MTTTELANKLEKLYNEDKLHDLVKYVRWGMDDEAYAVAEEFNELLKNILYKKIGGGKHND